MIRSLLYWFRHDLAARYEEMRHCGCTIVAPAAAAKTAKPSIPCRDCAQLGAQGPLRLPSELALLALPMKLPLKDRMRGKERDGRGGPPVPVSTSSAPRDVIRPMDKLPEEGYLLPKHLFSLLLG